MVDIVPGIDREKRNKEEGDRGVIHGLKATPLKQKERSRQHGGGISTNIIDESLLVSCRLPTEGRWER